MNLLVVTNSNFFVVAGGGYLVIWVSSIGIADPSDAIHGPI